MADNNQAVEAWAAAAERAPDHRARLRDLQRGRVGGCNTKERVAETLAEYKDAYPGLVTYSRPAGGGPETTWIVAPAQAEVA